MVKLAIVGSSALDRRQEEHARVIIAGVIWTWEPDEIWSGGAPGVDTIARVMAEDMGYAQDYPLRACIQGGECPGCTSACWAIGRFVEVLPEVQSWNPPGRKGYMARNAEIADSVDMLVRISKHDGQMTYGSGWTYDRAKERLGEEKVYQFYV